MSETTNPANPIITVTEPAPPMMTVAEMVHQLRVQRDSLKSELAQAVSKREQADKDAVKIRAELRDVERLLKAANPVKPAKPNAGKPVSG